ncbi:MAG: class I SAM-dependent methyltransferase, partial [Planctomycetota bacterium]
MRDLDLASCGTERTRARAADPLAQAHVLEIASGSGGPALHLARTTGCRVTGVDSNAHGVETANRAAREAGLGERAAFQVADANARL